VAECAQLGIGRARDPEGALGAAEAGAGHGHALELEAGFDPVARACRGVEAAGVVGRRRGGVALD
jgi:hypothetical protein